jgi:hypothetical protein
LPSLPSSLPSARSAPLCLLPDSGPKLGPEPLDEIAQQCSRLFVVLVSFGSDVTDPHDHSLRGIHCACLALQVKSRPAVLEAHPGRLAVDDARTLRLELAAPLVQIPGSPMKSIAA